MARADLLKTLFRSFKNRNDPAFLDAARVLAEEERRKHHHALADELLRILDNGVHAQRNGTKTFEPLPKDTDRGALLLEISQPDRYLTDLILTTCQTQLLSRVLREWREWDVLEANGLRPNSKLLFCGPPGCGKTATAQALSTELGVPLVTVRFDAVVSSLLG
jgi:ATP-dependent 26S proteasome regulatory subunit